jgi:uncharacterized protein
MSYFQRFSRRRQFALLLIAALLLLLVLLELPLVATLGGPDSPLMSRILGHRRLATIAVLLGGGVVFAALALLRRFRLLRFATLVALVGVLLIGAYAFQLRYPRADLFSLERLRDNTRVLLGEDVVLSRYAPRATLVLKRREVQRARYPAIDIHFHLESLSPEMTAERVVAGMDAAGIAKVINLGGLPGVFEQLKAQFYDKYPDRFVMFVKPDPGALQKPNGIAEQVEWLKKAARMGARGVKENKSFGLQQLDAAGRIVAIDDPRMDPLWSLAGKLGMPVLMHTGEPPAFWTPVDEHNERMEELLENPRWSLYGTSAPSRKDLMQQRERLLARHPGTNFIGAHLGMNPEDLEYAGHLLDTFPNYYVDMSSVVQELGREPYSARRFFIKYQDRILFGSDGGFGLQADRGWTPERMFRSYEEFLETDNEYIDYPLKSITKQGMWQVNGIDLPAEVLEKIYVKNAERLLPTNAAINAALAALPPAS